MLFSPRGGRGGFIVAHVLKMTGREFLGKASQACSLSPENLQATNFSGRNQMALAMTITDIDAAADNVYVFGTLAASGSYSTGGDTLDFTTVANQIAASQAPLQVWVGGTTGDSYAFVRAGSPTLANGKIKINTASNTELAAGSYPSRITGDTNIQFEAVFNKLI